MQMQRKVFIIPIPTSFHISAAALPVISINYTTSTTIQLSWNSSGSLVFSYEVTWEKNISVKCFKEDVKNGSATVSSTSYTITGLDEDRIYTITVIAINLAGNNAVSVPITVITMSAGEILNVII